MQSDSDSQTARRREEVFPICRHPRVGLTRRVAGLTYRALPRDPFSNA